MADSSTSPGKPDPWACHQRQADGQCIVTVNIGQFTETERQWILGVMANFSESPNIEVIEGQGGGTDVSIVVGKYKGTAGFFTDLQTRTTYIPRGWGLEPVCHEMMHSIAGAQDWEVPLRQFPSCFNGTSPYLGVEDFAEIALTYPLP